MEYQIVKDRGIERVIALVNSEMKKGWTCQGGIQVVTYGSGKQLRMMFYQAMVR